MTLEEQIRNKIEDRAEKSVNRNLIELIEADARVRHFKYGANLLLPSLLEALEALERLSKVSPPSKSTTGAEWANVCLTDNCNYASTKAAAIKERFGVKE